MSFFYFSPRFALHMTLALAPVGMAVAQAPVITTVIPMANARAAARTGPVMVSFSQPLTAASAGALQVFSSQRGGRRTGAVPATISGSTLGFTPTTYPFMPGETVQYTVTSAAASSGGTLARARVGQYTTAVSGTGRGDNFQLHSTLATGTRSFPTDIAVCDVDNDGDLDLLTVNSLNDELSVRLNNGSGVFSGTQNVALSIRPVGVAVGDVDGDGDIDVVAANGSSNPGTVSVRLNNGSGVFSGTQEVRVGNNPQYVTLGDVDGDGDLDLLVANTSASTVSIRLNDGSGVFSGTQNVSVSASPSDVKVGDVDGDGDLDLLTPSYRGSTVSVRLNDGTGTFSAGSEVLVGSAPGSASGSAPISIALGDVDGDNDLDLLSTNYYGTGVSVRLNNGTGVFGGTQNISVGSPRLTAYSITLGDFDGDGDLDFASTNFDTFYTIPATISIRINDGNGIFSGTQEIPTSINPVKIVAGDVDNDGDLDLVVDDLQIYVVNTFLNNSTALTTAGSASASLAVFPNPMREEATVTGLTPFTSCSVLDALGRIAFTTSADATGTAHLVLSEKLPAGLYILRGEGRSCRLMVE